MFTNGVTKWLKLPYSMVQEIENDPDHREMLIDRAPPSLTCSQCRSLCFERYDRTIPCIQDLDMSELHSILILDKWRMHYPTCGSRVKNVGFTDPYSHSTHSLKKLAERLCQNMPIANVATMQGLHWKTVKAINKRALQRTLAKPNGSLPQLLSIDKISYKSVRYISLWR